MSKPGRLVAVECIILYDNHSCFSIIKRSNLNRFKWTELTSEGYKHYFYCPYEFVGHSVEYFFCSALFWELECIVLLMKTNKVLLDNVMWSKVDNLLDQSFLLFL